MLARLLLLAAFFEVRSGGKMQRAEAKSKMLLLGGVEHQPRFSAKPLGDAGIEYPTYVGAHCVAGLSIVQWVSHNIATPVRSHPGDRFGFPASDHKGPRIQGVGAFRV